MQIETRNLSYTYGKNSAISNKALNAVTLTIPSGEFFGIIGKTGSGKSTFIQHLNGLIRVQKNSGEVRVGKFDLTDKFCDFKALRSKVGMVFQYPEYQLFGETVFSDVAFGVNNFMPNISQKDVTELVKNAIYAVGLDYEEVKDKSPFELSGGQKRRVAIAGVIVTKPEVLILDEPIAGLDPVGKREFMQLLKRLHSTFVKTVLIVSHDMDLICEHCSKLAIFDKGSMVYTGDTKSAFLEGQVVNGGLNESLTSYLTKQLKKRGILVDSDLTVDDFAKKIKEILVVDR